ncbi:MAG: DUF502 domain-containing protein [Phycisphaerales bacterium]|nr:MAG: DUF502 domain-containing protein [Phycisphaerales bacterium]
MDDFRRFFLRGLAVLVPTLLTLSILVWAYVFVNENVGVYITQGMLALAQRINETPTAPWVVDEQEDPLEYGVPIDQWDDHGQRLTLEYKVIHNRALKHAEEEVSRRALHAKNRALWEIAFRKYRLHLLGFLIAIVLVYFVGFFLASFVGRVSWRAAERLIGRTPVVRAIYPNVKQVTDFLLSERKVTYSGVVAVQYPRKGIWSVGLLTGDPMKRVQKESTEDLVTVFIPSSPTPVTGYVIQVPRSDVIELDVTIEEALRFTVSGGVIKPGASLPGPSESDTGD